MRRERESLVLPPLSQTTRHRRIHSIDDTPSHPPSKPSLLPHNSQSSVPFDPDTPYSSLLPQLSPLSDLILELDLTHRNPYSGLILHKLTESPVSDASFPSNLLRISIPHSKKLPSSLYNSSHNALSLERNLIRTVLEQRIESASEKLEAALQCSNKGAMKGKLMDCLQTSIETESKAYLVIWNQFLNALEELLARKTQKTPDFWTFSTLFEAISEIFARKEEIKTWESAEIALSRIIREILGKTDSKYLSAVIEQTWVLSLYFSHRFLKSQSQPAPPPSVSAELPVSVEVFPVQLQAAKAQISRLQITIERLRKDAEHYIYLLKDREAELKAIKTCNLDGNMGKLTEEISNYLADAEERQKENVEMLEGIRKLINWKENPHLTEEKNSKSDEKITKNEAKSDNFEEISDEKSEKREEEIYIENSDFSCQIETTMFENESKSVETERPKLTFSRISSIEIVKNEEIFMKKTGNLDIFSKKTDFEEKITVEKWAQTEEFGGSIEKVEEKGEKGSQTDDFVMKSEEETAGFSPRKPDFMPPAKRPNPLLLAIEKLARRQFPMPPKSLFRLLETAMDEKHRADSVDPSTPPRHMTEFMLDFMYMQYGLKALTLKSLSGMINALEIVSKGGECRYGMLFCRLLEVFTDKPIDDVLAAYLVKSRASFEQILHKFDRHYLKHSYLHGGFIPFPDVSDLLYDLFFPNQSEIGTKITYKLGKNSDWMENETGIVLICSKLARNNVDLREFYINMDEEKTGNVSFERFQKAIIENCKVLIDKKAVLSLWRSLVGDKETIGINQFVKLQTHQNAQKAANLKISKCDFLLEIVNEYDREKSLQIAHLQEIYYKFDQIHSGISNLSDFASLINSLNPEIPSEKCVSMFREALEFSGSEAVNCVSFCHIAEKHRLGETEVLRYFGTGDREVEERLRDRFLRYEHDQGNMAIATNKFRKPHLPKSNLPL